MKGFTKAALIMSLVLIVLGSMFCMISLGIGFNFSEFWDDVEEGEFSIGPIQDIPFVSVGNRLNWRDDGKDWHASSTEDYTFSCQGEKQEDIIDILELKVYYGTVDFVESTKDSDEIQVKVEYRKKNHRRNVEVYKDGTALRIEENGSRKSVWNDSTRVTIGIPANTKAKSGLFKKINMEQASGDVFVDVPLTADEININVNAGECDVVEEITALENFKAEIGAGKISLEQISAKEIVLKANVGEINTEELYADNISIDCGVGAIEAVAGGKEQDYNYDIKCNIGDVEIGDNSYSGFSSRRKVNNEGSKVMKVDCGVGSVEVSFED